MSQETIPNSSHLMIKLPSNEDLTWVASKTPLFELYLVKSTSKGPKARYFRFYENFILISKSRKSQKHLFLITLSKDFRVEVFRQLKSNNEETFITGFRFYKNFEEVIFTSMNCNDLNMIAKYVQARCFLLNFHDVYKPVMKIGKGTFADIYLIKNKFTDEKFAVKAFTKSNYASQEKGEQAILNEIKILRTLSQKNTVKLYEVYETDHSIYLVMELLESGDLKERLCEFPTINAIKSILKGIVNGLIYIHTLGIMHRDIKPENILFRKFKKSGKFLSEDERVCIADFGLATFLNEQNNIFEKCGTPGYVAPEILDLKENEICDVSCDVYSLGIIFHLMLLKTCPFDGKTVKEILKKNKNHLIDFNSEMYQHLNSNEIDLLKKMLDENPNTRIKTGDILLHPFFKEASKIIISNLEVISNIKEEESELKNLINNENSDQKTIPIIFQNSSPESFSLEEKNLKYKGKLKIRIYRFPAMDIESPNLKDNLESNLAAEKTKSPDQNEFKKKDNLQTIKENLDEEEKLRV